MPARPWQNRCPLGVTFVLLFAALSVSPVLTHFALGQSTSVGIYTDAAALDCSIIDAAPATISAYVVVRPGPGESVTGVQFSAPKPACFTGVYLSDVTAPGTLMLGNSQTGVSVSLFECSGVPTHVLTIQYFGYGTTPTCCQYPVIADPQETTVLAVDCDYSTLAVVGNVSRFNVDATCSCTGGSPPDPAYLPMPADGAVDVSVFASLAWDASDDDGDVAEFDVYLGTDPDPPLVASGLASGTYQPEQLSEFAQYYWRVVVRDELGLETSGPVWTFTTRGVNTPPVAPFNPFPSDGAVEVRLGPDLRWYCSDTDGDSLSYDVYYGTTFPPPLVVADYPYTAYSTQGAPPNTQCYWQIVAHDATSQVAGPVWSYTTRVSNLSPSPPSSPVPANGATNVSVLETCRWVIKPDVEQDPLTFDVYFGTTNPPPLVAQLILPIYDPGLLDFMTVYYWRVIARDPGMLTSTGGVWSFTTGLAGDSDGDGIVELADAQCALHEFLFGPSCAGNGGRHAASVVDCSAALTPRDARCIHKFVADGSCSFCTQASLEPVVFTGSPVVEASEVHQELDTLVVTLSVSGVPSLEAFGMDVVPMTEGVDLVRASRTTATGAFVVGGSSARIGGYSLTGVPASSATDFITLRFTIPVGHSEILLNAPVDDL
ncbi:MAG TPA: hypothetical protein VFX92_12290, partial [Candidatus Krumholzibacteria bacterium]|nr:hypothetical protein [Candidatus Krumholzibacteria bacterium]